MYFLYHTGLERMSTLVCMWIYVFKHGRGCKQVLQHMHAHVHVSVCRYFVALCVFPEQHANTIAAVAPHTNLLLICSLGYIVGRCACTICILHTGMQSKLHTSAVRTPIRS